MAELDFQSPTILESAHSRVGELGGVVALLATIRKKDNILREVKFMYALHLAVAKFAHWLFNV